MSKATPQQTKMAAIQAAAVDAFPEEYAGSNRVADEGQRCCGSPVDGSSCVNSGPLSNGQGYSVTFPETGDYKLVCLFHQNHTAVIHVLDLSAQLPHEQAFYSAQATDMQKDLLSSADHLMDHDMASSRMGVTAGTGAIVATAAVPIPCQ